VVWGRSTRATWVVFNLLIYTFLQHMDLDIL
jgi:hypothetical protein